MEGEMATLLYIETLKPSIGVQLKNKTTFSSFPWLGWGDTYCWEVLHVLIAKKVASKAVVWALLTLIIYQFSRNLFNKHQFPVY